jgi:hypothetical protein
MGGVDELLAFVRRCLDDDERVALETLSCEASPWRPYEGTYGWAVATESGGVIRDGDFDGPQVVAEHIARWDPQRVLALTRALRTVIDEFSWEGRETAIVIALAGALYAGRDGWREEWLVSGGS